MRPDLYKTITGIRDSCPDQAEVKSRLTGELEALRNGRPDDYVADLFYFMGKAVRDDHTEILVLLEDVMFDVFDTDPRASEIVPYFVLAISGLTDLIFLDPDSNLKLKQFGMNMFPPGLGLPEIIYAYSKKDIPIMLVGETGTSKGWLARALHKMGPRRDKPYRPVNCAAMPETLIESMLFGYKKGAFTSAAKGDMTGILHHVNHGTLLLDELGEMPTHWQVKLLNVIEDGKFYPIGSDKAEEIDIRFIAAMQPRHIDENKIYPDLLWRLGYPDMIKLPPLRERLKIIPEQIIVNSLRIVLKKLKLDKDRWLDPYITPVMSAIENYKFPGNYRELENVLRRMIILNDLANSDLDHIIQACMTPCEPDDGTTARDVEASITDNEDIRNVRLRDILDHAERVSQSMVESKLRAILKSGKDIKNVLLEEGLSYKEYQTYYGRIKRIIGKGIRDL